MSGGWDGETVDFEALIGEGKYPVTFAAKNRSDAVRARSSSGGVFHALASHVIADGGVVYGCAFDERLRAAHVRCADMAGVERCMGSKYSQSRMGDSISRVRGDLEAGLTVLFTGTPCQVSAVRAACSDLAGGLILADVVCHGVPSPGVFAEHLSYIRGLRGRAVEAYEHRPKSRGWGHSELFRLEGGEVEQGTPLADSWRGLFYDNRMLRPSCYRCPYASTTRVSDVTIADYWGIGRTPLAGLEDDLGVSLVLANTDRGLGVLSSLRDVALWRTTLGDALPGNPMLVAPSTHVGDRSDPWTLMASSGYGAMVREMGFHESEARWLARSAMGWAKVLVKWVIRYESWRG